MNLSDYYPVIIMVAVIVAAICALRIFFTLWALVDRRINGDQFGNLKRLPIIDFKDKMVSIQFKSGNRIEGVALLGYGVTNPATPYPLRQMLMAEFFDGRKVCCRMEEIEYIEEQPKNGESGEAGRTAR